VNYDLFIVDYRGYGKSTGHIESEDGAEHNDIHRFPNYLDALSARLLAAGNP
jgi:pimeloyl-ACP methyl ester carboxylesterase